MLFHRIDVRMRAAHMLVGVSPGLNWGWLFLLTGLRLR